MIRKRAAVLAFCFLMLISAASAAGFRSYLEQGTVPSLKDVYAGRMEIGVEAEALLGKSAESVRLAAGQCGLLACDRETGTAALDRSRSKSKKDPERAGIIIGKAAEAMVSAQEHGMKVRAGTVIRTADIPDWFFRDGWSTSAKAAKADRQTMTRRAEHAVKDQIELLNGKYPGLITEWTVVCGDLSTEGNPFREAIGDDYIRIAFTAARSVAEKGQKLLWQVSSIPDEAELRLLRELCSEGLADGIIIACRMQANDAELHMLEEVLDHAASAGAEVHLSGLEIDDTDRTAEGQMLLAARYKAVLSAAERHGAVSVSFAALQDEADRKAKGTPQRLFDANGRCAAAFFGVLQDEDIPPAEDREAIRAAAENLELDIYLKKGEDPVTVYKKAENHNPVMVQRFGADPWAMVYGGRVYLYMTGDEPTGETGGKPKENDYSNIVTLRVISSDDLVNWTDHGSVCAAGGKGAAKWASNSWAPCAAWKNIDGKDRFFLYFANSGGGIGVLTSDSPTGPFTDPIGKALVSRSTPTCAGVTWLFDPAILVDEDGSAYLYFGGGIPDGRAADPGTARVVKLNSDMISLDGDPAAINPPWLFEDSGINRFGSTYVYSYCSNFNVPGASEQGFTGGEIVYMTSESPMGPFAYAGRILLNPGSFFGVGGNNHHCMFSFNGQWYITYHAATLDKAMGWGRGYRSTFVDRLELDSNGLPAPSKGTYKGVQQAKAFDPYGSVSGATAVSMAGVTTELAYAQDRKAGTGQMAAVSTASGGWIAVAGADFGEKSAAGIRMTVRSEIGAKTEIVPDTADGEPAAVLEIPACEGDTEVTAGLPVPLAGKHDLYFRFTESGVRLVSWQFEQQAR